MAKTTTINVRIDEEVKRDVEFLLDKLGMNTSTVVNMLFKQMLMDEALPFKPTYRRRHQTTAERLMGYHGEYMAEEWDTGAPIGREVF